MIILRRLSAEHGTSLLEILVGITLLSIMTIALGQSTRLALGTRATTVRNSAAMQLALEALEEFSYSDPSTLSDADDLSETVIKNSAEYTRVIDITENADESKTIDITVTGNNEKLGGEAAISTKLMAWGEA